MAQWMGYMVSIRCADQATYQGEINLASNDEIVLIKAFCNGIPCPQNKVTIRARDIVELKLIDKQNEQPKEGGTSTVTIAKPIAKRAGRVLSTSENTPVTMTAKQSSTSGGAGNVAKSRPIDIEPPKFNSSFNNNNTHNSANYNSSINNSVSGPESIAHSLKNGSTPNARRDKPKKWVKGWKDEEAFGSPLDSKINKEFDFEKNLALFNKQAIWEEINSQKPDVIRNIEGKKASKYRHDENVIASTPATYRQIIVPKQDFCEYVTDDGLIIPSISRTLRKKLWEAADRAGLTWEKRVELLGRAAAEISIQLLGGGHRLNPHNSHQFPTVVVLCGPHRQGAVGINAARQLASHGVRLVVYTQNPDVPVIKNELFPYTLTRNKVARSVSELPSFADLIIVALCDDDPDNPPTGYPEVCEWATRNRAPILALDPPSGGTPGLAPKYSLLPVLPLPHSRDNGKLYLCNLGFPVGIFSEVGIQYRSPFGPKFVIPLHPRDD